ncbi:hypothetical protein M0R88_12805 [Halorussus gelatinilyticus]|uniref:Uncharacterized protein n=1 Tax=Halorussus gelatinilyticus TaxID=2937524 RepID=A0A8U0IFC4_9EURY|nr:hypothetical protein [Halorussus gelatinilyticus]UPV99400.1 hypothetical protein M0R88_12805 [Halorussus gelatinilyticus]
MHIRAGERVRQFVQQRVGTSLHCVGAYDMESFSVLYRSDEVERAFSDDGVDEYSELVRTVHRTLYEADRLNSAVGEPRCNLTYYGGMHVLLVPIDEENGVTVALSKESGTQFSEFADECLRRARAEVE